MIRQVKIARDTARKGRTSAVITLKQIVVNAPAELREALDDLPDKALIDRCAGYRVKTIDSTTASAKHTLRALARRWLDLDAEIAAHDAVLDDLTAQASPTLRDAYGIGPDCAAEILIVFGDNPERIRSEAAFAKLCGTCPIPASSGPDEQAPPLPRRSPPSERSALPDRDCPHAVPPADDRLRRPTDRRRTHEEGHHPVRCLKRFLAREVYQAVMTDHRARQGLTPAA